MRGTLKLQESNMKRLNVFILAIFLIISLNAQAIVAAINGKVFIPIITSVSDPNTTIRTINVPNFNVTDLTTKLSEMSILWFGAVNLNSSYSDVRIGYNNSELLIHAQVFDRLLWYNPNPSDSPFENWDSFAVTLNLGPNAKSPTVRSYRFVGQLYWWEGSSDYMKSYVGNGSSWISTPLNFSVETSWRGNSPNDTTEDRGWVITFHIPFSTLGLAGTPMPGTVWQMGLSSYNRNSEAGPALAPQYWPENSNIQSPDSWGQLRFGMPIFTTPSVQNQQTTTIREGLNNNHVPNVQVGGSSVCGEGLNYWTQWGNTNYAGSTFFNVQNQADVADWPCFSKYFVTFPITNIPAGKVIKSAKLIMHQFGNADPTVAEPSLIQVMSVNEDWQETSLTWNNSPMAFENFAQTWVNVMQNGTLTWPGIEYDWDVSRAVDQAYRKGSPVKLVLYSSDTNYSSGKYFTTSEAGDWDAVGRPTLIIDWGDPMP
jgi:hypothetical protein